MRDEDVIPDPQLMESMRAVGYTLETAVADIIDNSITAGGNQVDVWFTAIPNLESQSWTTARAWTKRRCWRR